MSMVANAVQAAQAKATRSLNFKKLIKKNVIERKGRGWSTYYQRKES